MHVPSLPGAARALMLVLMAACITLIMHVRNAPRPATQQMHAPLLQLNIDTSTAAELSLIPGLGDVLTQRILDERDRRGGFTSIDELDQIAGIGTVMLERVRQHVQPISRSAQARSPK